MLNSQQKVQDLKAEVQQNTTPQEQNTPPQPTHTENMGFRPSYTQQNTPPQPDFPRIGLCNGKKNDAELRQSPGGTTIGMLPSGSRFMQGTSRQGEWVSVSSSQGTGWIHSCFLP
jgi:hypothetical protein